jgi:ATP-dependent DNA helicase RecG
MKLGKETETLEFKKTTGELKEAVVSIASILNKSGKGELYFGIKNNGAVVGQQIGDATLRDVSKALSDNLKPQIFPTIDAVMITVNQTTPQRSYLAKAPEPKSKWLSLPQR